MHATQQNTTTSTHTCPDCDDTHPLGQEKNVDQPFPTGPFQAHSTWWQKPMHVLPVRTTHKVLHSTTFTFSSVQSHHFNGRFPKGKAKGQGPLQIAVYAVIHQWYDNQFITRGSTILFSIVVSLKRFSLINLVQLCNAHPNPFASRHWIWCALWQLCYKASLVLPIFSSLASAKPTRLIDLVCAPTLGLLCNASTGGTLSQNSSWHLQGGRRGRWDESRRQLGPKAARSWHWTHPPIPIVLHQHLLVSMDASQTIALAQVWHTHPPSLAAENVGIESGLRCGRCAIKFPWPYQFFLLLLLPLRRGLINLICAPAQAPLTPTARPTGDGAETSPTKKFKPTPTQRQTEEEAEEKISTSAFRVWMRNLLHGGWGYDMCEAGDERWRFRKTPWVSPLWWSNGCWSPHTSSWDWQSRWCLWDGKAHHGGCIQKVLTTRCVYDWGLKTRDLGEGNMVKMRRGRSRLVARDYGFQGGGRSDAYSPASSAHLPRMLPCLYF